MHIVKAVSLKVASTLMFALMGAQVRFLGGAYPVGEVVFCRALFALIPILIVFGWRGELHGALRTSRPKDHALRGIYSIVGTFCTFGALARIPLADFTAIAFIAPLITVIFAALFLKEQVRIYRWTAVVVGFAGVILMLLPYLGNRMDVTSSLGLAFALTNALSAGAATVQIRRLTTTETTVAIVVYMTLLVMLFALTTVGFGWRMPATWFDVIALIGVGVSGGVAQILFTDSYRYAPASFLAVFDYTAMPWAFMFGYLFFAEVPAAFVAVGAVIVAGAGTFVMVRERQLGLARPSETALTARAVTLTKAP